MPLLTRNSLQTLPVEVNTGALHMETDRQLLKQVQAGILPTTLRFYRFSEPTVTYGRLQNIDDVHRLAPAGWPVVVRPTGGGIVFHENDLCFSLAWSTPHPLIPKKPSEQYQWIHGIVLQALSPWVALSRVSCKQSVSSPAPFHERQCFQEPVPCDLMMADQKVVGGALAYQKSGVLYQGSIQTPLPNETLVSALQRAFETQLA